MSRTIPVLLLDHLQQDASTTCRLLRIALADGEEMGFSSTNAAIRYDAGAGELVYQRQSGFDQSALITTNTTAVDNSEARILLSPGTPFTEAQVIAGRFDGAQWWIYEVNYEDLSQGHAVLGHGIVGKPKVGPKGAYITIELRSWLDLLRQEPWEHWQRRCRVRTFGSQPGDERFPCRYNLAGEWINDVPVTSVGVENNRTFTASSLAQAEDYFAPGMWLWTTGPNAGRSYEIAEFGAGGVVTLTFPTDYPISEDDEGDIRRDCTREWEGHNSCQTYDNRINFRAEPKIRPADVLATQIPGAQSSPGQGGAEYVPDPSTDPE